MPENPNRVQALTHLKAAIMQVEKTMDLDSATWDGTDEEDALDAINTIANLIHTLEPVNV